MPKDLRRYLEHTLLAADVTRQRIEAHCRQAAEHGLYAVCIAPVYVPLAKECLRGTPVRVVTVSGFPLGANTSEVKASEAKHAIADGADEVDMVMAIGLALGGAFDAVEADVRLVRNTIPEAALKVIIETSYFDHDGIKRAAEAAVRAGANFVKTSTGFGPRGATIDDVKLLYATVSGRAEVKASGGIRTAAVALEMIEAGATRIGTSCGVDLVTSSGL
jgi:deoxyribose-phosphate aldolase